MKSAKEYRNIVFDMGGVLVDYTADNATWHYTDDPEIVREIHNVLFCSQEWMALDMGSMTDEQAIMRILPRLSSEKVREIAKATFEHWHEYNNVARPGMEQIVRALKTRGQMLALKPQPIIYQMFFERFGLNSADCFFIDDVQDNVEASIRCGMDAWWFNSGNNQDIKQILEIDSLVGDM